MNIERLDTIRMILAEMKQMADEVPFHIDQNHSNDIPLLTQMTEDLEEYEDVPEEAVPLRIEPTYTTRLPKMVSQKQSPFKRQKSSSDEVGPPLPNNPKDWNEYFLAGHSSVSVICQYLPTRDLLSLSKTSYSLRKVALTALMGSALSEKECQAIEWQTIINYEYLGRHHAHTFISNASNNDEQSEHSRDLDRTFLVEQLDSIDRHAMSRLDRVMRALCISVEYFQSLNYITAAFLSRYDQQLSYWCTRYLLRKVNYFQTQIPLLNSQIALLNSIVEHQLPMVHAHLRNSDLSLEYFADRWLIPLFSYDSELEVMLKLWRLISLSDANMLVCFVLAMLKKLEKRILEADEEQLNCLLKVNLKAEMRAINSSELLRDSVSLYLQHFVSRVSLHDERIDEEVVHNRTTALPVGASANP